MPYIKNFEEIKAWGEARELVKEIYEISDCDKFSKDWSLKDQIRRAGVSIMSNIAEGHSRQTDKEFLQFLYISKGSLAELLSQLYIAMDLSYIDKEKFKELHDKTEEIAKLIGGFIRYLSGETDVREAND
jgi:four helix bundle protein